MFVRNRGVWFGFAEKVFTFCLEKSRTHVFNEDDCHPSLNLYSFTNIGWSLRLLQKTWKAVVFVSNKFMSSCVICLVIAREIFPFLSDCSAITKVHKFSLLSLLYN